MWLQSESFVSTFCEAMYKFDLAPNMFIVCSKQSLIICLWSDQYALWRSSCVTKWNDLQWKEKKDYIYIPTTLFLCTFCFYPLLWMYLINIAYIFRCLYLKAPIPFLYTFTQMIWKQSGLTCTIWMLSFFDQKKKCICASCTRITGIYFFSKFYIWEFDCYCIALRPVAKCLNYRRFDMHTH